MSETTADWTDLKQFLAVARSGGLSAAARASGSSPATMGRRMLALERALDRRLFVRHERGYELTQDGKTLFAELKLIEAQIERVTAPVHPERAPKLHISAGTWTTFWLLQHFNALRGSPPDVHLCFVTDEALRDIPHREVSIGFRNQRPTDIRLAGKKLRPVTFAGYGTADAPERWIKVVGTTPSARWLAGRAVDDAVCEVNTPRCALDLALAGQGIAVLPTFVGRLQPYLIQRQPVIPELTHDQWLVTHHDDRHLPEVRQTIDRISDLFERPPSPEMGRS